MEVVALRSEESRKRSRWQVAPHSTTPITHPNYPAAIAKTLMQNMKQLHLSLVTTVGLLLVVVLLTGACRKGTVKPIAETATVPKVIGEIDYPAMIESSLKGTTLRVECSITTDGAKDIVVSYRCKSSDLQPPNIDWSRLAKGLYLNEKGLPESTESSVHYYTVEGSSPSLALEMLSERVDDTPRWHIDPVGVRRAKSQQPGILPNTTK